MICHTCHGHGTVTDRGRFYDDPSVTSRCPDCSPAYDAKAGQAERMAELDRIEDEITARRKLYPSAEMEESEWD